MPRFAPSILLTLTLTTLLTGCCARAVPEVAPQPVSATAPHPSLPWLDATDWANAVGNTNARMTIQAKVVRVGPLPPPINRAYADHIMMVELADAVDNAGQKLPYRLPVYLRSLKANVWLPAAQLQPGTAVTVQIQSWGRVARMYEGMNRSDLADLPPELMPFWGELVAPAATNP
ncbi:MAG: hypothetical protein WCJ97_09735 [Phycisphaerae bacterium]